MVVNALLPEYALMLDAIAPTRAPRTTTNAWDRPAWDRAVHVAGWHRLVPALHCHLDGRGNAPAEIRRRIEAEYLGNVARTAFLSSALDGAVAALAGVGVTPMLLKGAALIRSVYTDPARREMLDLDLLVPADSIADAAVALGEIGYRTNIEDGVEAKPNVHHAAALVAQDGLLAVELHHHITLASEGRAFDIDDFWRRARAVRGAAYVLPSHEDLLLHVCVHFTRNRLAGDHRRRNTGGALAQIADIAALLTGESIDWGALAMSSRSYRLESQVFLALFVASELGVPVDRDGLALLRPASFDPRLGTRLAELRVLKADDHLPVRSAKWMIAPSREVLTRGWNANPDVPLSIAGAYVRRAWAHAPAARAALRRPWTIVQDQRLNRQIYALESHE
jgi:hypothetical protein